MIIREGLKFGETEVRLDVSQYAEGNRLLLQLESPVVEDGELLGWEPYMRLTCNLPDEPLAGDEMFVKNWSENEGADEWMVRQGLIMPSPEGYSASGYVQVPRYKMTLGFYKEIFEAVLSMGLKGDFNVG